MRIYFAYTRLIIFAAAILLGLQVPGFVEQYGTRLEARMLEAKQSLSKFQTNADKYFAGDFSRLIQHYKNNTDQVIKEGGANLEALHKREQSLSSAHAHFSRNRASPFLHTFLEPLEDVRDNTWKNYNFLVLLNTASIIWGIVSGLLLILIIDLLFGTFRVCLSAMNGNLFSSDRPVKYRTSKRRPLRQKPSKRRRAKVIAPRIGL